ncbi:hypothetical protein SDC9_173998 [bioreactor metagenome]|uniref:Uncharacterized protein n=1 Tax=bioreactor metagenome TaxID=1076179 RepID=A0A645GSG7_9ZZZZ
MIPFSLVRPIDFSQVLEPIRLIFFVQIIGGDHATADQKMHAFLGKDDITLFHLLCKLPGCMSSIHVRL